MLSGSDRRLAFAGAMLVMISVTVLWFIRLNSPDPRFDMQHLQGKTTTQVVGLLGTPLDDPRTGKEAWTVDKENTLGPLMLVYRDNPSSMRLIEHYYGIVFKDGKVYRVNVGHK
jgi:hypothetical protein